MLIAEIAEEFEKESYATFEDRADEQDEDNASFLAEGGVEDQEAKKTILRKVIDYKYMDGLRGIGAFAVYLFHFFWELMPM